MNLFEFFVALKIICIYILAGIVIAIICVIALIIMAIVSTGQTLGGL